MRAGTFYGRRATVLDPSWKPGKATVKAQPKRIPPGLCPRWAKPLAVLPSLSSRPLHSSSTCPVCPFSLFRSPPMLKPLFFLNPILLTGRHGQRCQVVSAQRSHSRATLCTRGPCLNSPRFKRPLRPLGHRGCLPRRLAHGCLDAGPTCRRRGCVLQRWRRRNRPVERRSCIYRRFQDLKKIKSSLYSPFVKKVSRRTAHRR